MKDLDHILEKTKQQIKPVEASDYILTRAIQQFENIAEVATPKFLWGTSLATAVLLIFNVYVLGQQSNTESNVSDVETYASSMGLTSSNQLYSNE